MKYKILMALMGLEIGGAETHVVELVKELKKQGYDIVVASNGGVYEDELLKSGVRHYKVPLHKRNVFYMLRSYFALKDIIKKENFDIVHSHARIPGFICGLLKKSMKFTFVTSAHWVFYTGMGLKYLTNWGQKVVAVSDDIKRYLIENYKVRDRDIYVTINGIDTSKFSPENNGENILNELGLKKAPTIVYVSRMDADRAMVAGQLIDIAEWLIDDINDLQIIIVGGGNVFDELNERANAVNKKVGRKVIAMMGGRTDINNIVAAADVFVGVSRAALEAMAAGKTTIVAGNEGYIGIFSRDKLGIAQENNFCCRGCPMSNKKSLHDDIIKCFNMTAEERAEYGLYGRSVIIENYSVTKMALDCVKAYDSAYKQSHEKQYGIVMSGYYGFNNSGDEAILITMHNNIQRLGENMNITVLSNNPDETNRKYGFDVVYRFSFFEVMKALIKSDVLLSGGGSLLQDRTSTRSLMYYLSIIVAAKMLGKKVMLYANGIGPVSRDGNRKMVKRVVNMADIITLREQNSYDELCAMGVDKNKAFVTADPVFSMEGISKDKALEMLQNSGVPTDKPIVGVSVRSWSNIDRFIDDFAKLCDDICQKYDRNIVFIVMHMPNDINVSKKVQSKMKNKSYILDENLSPYEVLGIIGCMDFILSMRLHTLIFAARQRVPLIGYIYDPKIEYYLETLQMPSGGRIEEFSYNDSIEKIDDMVKNRQRYVDTLEVISKELENAANKNEQYLLKLLEGNGI